MIFKNQKLFSVFLCFSLILSPGAVLATTTATTEINGGELSISGLPDSISMSPVTIDGVNWKASLGNVPDITVTDARGTGEGWRLSVSASQVTEIGGAGLTLPAGSISFFSPATVSPVGETSSPSPVLPTDSYGVIDLNPYTLATAAENTGLGTYKITFYDGTFGINISPSTKAVDKVNYPNSATPYQTTLTWTLSNTP